MNWQMSLSLFEGDEFLVQLSVESTNFVQMCLLWIIVCWSSGLLAVFGLDSCWWKDKGRRGCGEDESEEKEVIVAHGEEE